ncbi:hypothetical protein [Caudoviricetes sp.]|nr:hypothetical protein [Caudoviricetes sp.]UOF79137.1 hypothetical protein [Caudoviricetes sp.]
MIKCSMIILFCMVCGCTTATKKDVPTTMSVDIYTLC